MRSLLALVAVFVLLAGCDQLEQSSSATSTGASAVASQEGGKVVVRLSDGTGLSFKGKLVKSVLNPNERGHVRMNVIDVVGDRADVEKDVSETLTNAGYVRQMQVEKDDMQRMHFFKKPSPTVGGQFNDVVIDGKSVVRVSIYWQDA